MGTFGGDGHLCNRLLCLLIDITFSTTNMIYFYALLKNSEMRLLISSCPSARNNSVPTGRIFMEFDI